MNLLGALGIGLADLQTAAMTNAAGCTYRRWPRSPPCSTDRSSPFRQLSQVLAVTHSGTVRLADRLSTHAIELGISADARQSPVTFTPRVGRAAREALRARREVLQILLDRLPEAQGAWFFDALATVLAGLANDEIQVRHLCRLCEHGHCRNPNCPSGVAAHKAPAVGLRR